MSLIQILNQMAPPGLLGNKCVEMDTAEENVCCGNTRCITDLEAFFSICVDHLVLTVAILNRVDIRADPVDYSPSSYQKDSRYMVTLEEETGMLCLHV